MYYNCHRLLLSWCCEIRSNLAVGWYEKTWLWYYHYPILYWFFSQYFPCNFWIFCCIIIVSWHHLQCIHYYIFVKQRTIYQSCIAWSHCSKSFYQPYVDRFFKARLYSNDDHNANILYFVQPIVIRDSAHWATNKTHA